MSKRYVCDETETRTNSNLPVDKYTYTEIIKKRGGGVGVRGWMMGMIHDSVQLLHDAVTVLLMD